MNDKDLSCWLKLAAHFLCDRHPCDECKLLLHIVSGCPNDGASGTDTEEFVVKLNDIITSMSQASNMHDLTESDWMSILEAVNDS